MRSLDIYQQISQDAVQNFLDRPKISDWRIFDCQEKFLVGQVNGHLTVMPVDAIDEKCIWVGEKTFLLGQALDEQKNFLEAGNFETQESVSLFVKEMADAVAARVGDRQKKITGSAAMDFGTRMDLLDCVRNFLTKNSLEKVSSQDYRDSMRYVEHNNVAGLREVVERNITSKTFLGELYSEAVECGWPEVLEYLQSVYQHGKSMKMENQNVDILEMSKKGVYGLERQKIP